MWEILHWFQEGTSWSKGKRRKDVKRSERRRKRRMKERFCSVLQRPGAHPLEEKREMYISKKGRKSEQEIDEYKLLSTLQWLQ